VNGTWSTGACDRTDAIAACEDNLTRVWFYKGGSVQKPAHVATLCADRYGKLLDANGKKLKDVTPEQAPPEEDHKLAALLKAMGAPLEQRVAAVEKVKLSDGPSGRLRPSGGKHITANAAVVNDGDLLWLTDLADHDGAFPLPDGPRLRACAFAVRQTFMAQNDPAKRKEELSWCGQLEYLLVVRTSAMELPQTYNNNYNFVAGHAKGDVQIFELPSGKSIGGYAFRVASSEKLKESELARDFRANFEKAVSDGLAKADPGSALKVTFVVK
jgi:hypothetical protein